MWWFQTELWVMVWTELLDGAVGVMGLGGAVGDGFRRSYGRWLGRSRDGSCRYMV